MPEMLGFWDTVIVTSKLNWCSNGVVGNFTKPKTPYFRAFSGFLTDISQTYNCIQYTQRGKYKAYPASMMRYWSRINRALEYPDRLFDSSEYD